MNKNIQMKDGIINLYPKTKASLLLEDDETPYHWPTRAVGGYFNPAEISVLSFKTLESFEEDFVTITILGNKSSDITITWGDGTWDILPAATNNYVRSIRHTYPKGQFFNLGIKGPFSLGGRELSDNSQKSGIIWNSISLGTYLGYNLDIPSTVSYFSIYDAPEVINFTCSNRKILNYQQWSFPKLLNLTLAANSAKLWLFDYNTKVKTINASYQRIAEEISGLDLSECTQVTNAFSNSTSLKVIPDLSKAKAAYWTGVCKNCPNLETFPTIIPDVVVSIQDAFSGCTKMTELPSGGNNVINASYAFANTNIKNVIKSWPSLETGYDMFSGNKSVTEIPSITADYFPKLTNAESMFSNCLSIAKVNDITMNYLENASSMFSRGSSWGDAPQLKTVGKLIMPRLINASYMFFGCKNLESISGLSMRFLEDASYMFSECKKLKVLNFDKTVHLAKLDRMFNDCSALTTISNVDIDSEVKNMSLYGVFDDCVSLTETPAWNCINVTSFSGIFDYCASLHRIKFTNINANLSLTWNYSYCPLEHDALVELIGNLMPQTSGNKTLTLGYTLKAKLSPEEIKVATDKGWTIA